MFKFASSLAAAAVALHSTDAFSYPKMIRTTPTMKSLLTLNQQYQPQQDQQQYQPQEQYEPHQGQEGQYQSQGQYQPQDQFEQPHPAETGALDRAMDCANNFGMCDIEEVLDLSDELDAYMGCFVEDGPEACENEIGERQGLANALLMQGEAMQEQHQQQFGQQGGDGNGGEFFENGPQGQFVEEGGYVQGYVPSFEDQPPMQNNFGSPVPPTSMPPTVGTSGSVRNKGGASLSDFLPKDFAMSPDSFRGSQSHYGGKDLHNGNF